jgi:N-acetylmuramoyl-L-alanine amidase
MPAVLLELSFLSNPTEEARLADGRYRDLLARAIAEGVARPMR